jgi:nicotinamide mononucleotide transporter
MSGVLVAATRRPRSAWPRHPVYARAPRHLSTYFVSFNFPSATTLIEPAAFVLALGYVLLSIRQVHWAWPLMIGSSVLYGLLFATARLYGQMALQAAFVAIALWGWWQWKYGLRGTAPLKVTVLSLPVRLALIVGCAVVTLGAAFALGRWTDAASPALDAFTTVGSLIAQTLTARKFTEAWPAWLLVNGVSLTLFVQQQLWLTALLYGLFVVLSVVGWHAWLRDAQRRAAVQP